MDQNFTNLKFFLFIMDTPYAQKTIKQGNAGKRKRSELAKPLREMTPKYPITNEPTKENSRQFFWTNKAEKSEIKTKIPI